MMKNGVYFVVIALVVAELIKIFSFMQIRLLVGSHCGPKMM